MQHVIDCQIDAIGWSAVNRINRVPHLLEPQRPPQRQRVTDRARFLDRRDHDDLTEPRERLSKRLNTFGMNTIVIRDENSWHRNLRS